MEQQKKPQNFAQALRSRPGERAPREGEAKREESPAAPVATPALTAVPTPVITPVATPAPTPVKQSFLDATHSPSEKSVFSVMYRETVSKGVAERHFGFKELSQKTGIRSDTTIRKALDGLLAKFSIEIVSYHHGNPLGPRYRVFEPKDIERNRRTAGIEIDPQSKKITKRGTTGVPTGVGTGVPTGGRNYGSTPVVSTGVTPATSTGVLYKYINNNLEASDDDDELTRAVRQLVSDVTGREATKAEISKFVEVIEVLSLELKIAAARTTVSSVAPFLAEHLRRRLFKKNKQELAMEVSSAPGEQISPSANMSQCPDCHGTGMFYPDGYEKGVAKCTHERLLELEKGATSAGGADALG